MIGTTARRQANAAVPATGDDPMTIEPTTQFAAWSSFAACYASELASYQAAIDAAEDIDQDDELHAQLRPYYETLVAFPVEAADQLAEKVLLLEAECWDANEALKALARDAERICNR